MLAEGSELSCKCLLDYASICASYSMMFGFQQECLEGQLPKTEHICTKKRRKPRMKLLRISVIKTWTQKKESEKEKSTRDIKRKQEHYFTMEEKL